MKRKKVLMNEIETLIKSNKELQGYLNLQTELKKASGVVYRDMENFNIAQSLFSRIRSSLLSVFKYEGLPEEIPFQQLESLLFEKGSALFWRVGGKFYIGNYVNIGELDYYRNPIKVQPVYLNGRVGTTKTVNVDCVIIRNNFEMLSTMGIIHPFINRMVLNFESGANNLKMSMTKYGIKASPEIMNNVLTSLQKMFDNNGLIAPLPLETGYLIETLPFFEKFESKDYWEDFNNTKSLLYALLGINTNPNEDKKERLLVDEVNANNEQVNTITQSMFEQRSDGINKINKIFELQVKITMTEEKQKDDSAKEEKDNEKDDNSEE